MYTAGYIVWVFLGSDEIMQVQWVFSMDSDLYPGLRKGCFAVCVNSSVVAMVIDTITMTTTSTGSISLPAALHQMPMSGQRRKQSPLTNRQGL